MELLCTSSYQFCSYTGAHDVKEREFISAVNTSWGFFFSCSKRLVHTSDQINNSCYNILGHIPLLLVFTTMSFPGSFCQVRVCHVNQSLFRSSPIARWNTPFPVWGDFTRHLICFLAIGDQRVCFVYSATDISYGGSIFLPLSLPLVPLPSLFEGTGLFVLFHCFVDYSLGSTPL